MLQLLDLAGIYFRAFHAVPSSITGPDGRPVNAVRGTLDIVRRVVQDARPQRLVACLDLDWRPEWRVRLLPSYKAHRVAGPAPDAAPPPELPPGVAREFDVHGGDFVEEVPDELGPQVPVILDILRAVGVTLAGAEGFEADDVIGTLAAAEQDDPVEVVTGDRDLFQVARDAPTPVRVRYIGAGMSKVQVLGTAEVADRHGIPAGRYADFAVLRGDPSDGLPGVAGIGDKTAAALVREWGAVEDIAAAARDGALSGSVRTKLVAAADYLGAAPAVVRVATDAPVRMDPAGDGRLTAVPADGERLVELAQRHGVSSAVARLLDALGGG
ncbi:5'-3' exonuclease [Nakamurella endophytica]|uniref:5'-3' exonuclease n=1 Tax=Nakamurella endophytica TaxID=1748367 RepID=A0A917SQK8_9ACTN|nr:5'-3' exonuclease [Nakamurella endophytica]GGL91316.1 5'-3' exonuclease [Nakamurella endophytica]